MIISPGVGVQLTNILLRTGIENVKNKRRSLSHKCLDWSERRHHLTGALGNALLEKLLELNWVQRLPKTRAIKITSEGKIGFKEVGQTKLNNTVIGAKTCSQHRWHNLFNAIPIKN
ncbi:hypothetical protein PUR_50540 [Paenibacillus sp. URB8-2]|nr:hypothetical protein PUR_50540 [Paenibacillus sp. URB8-2]